MAIRSQVEACRPDSKASAACLAEAEVDLSTSAQVEETVPRASASQTLKISSRNFSDRVRAEWEAGLMKILSLDLGWAVAPAGVQGANRLSEAICAAETVHLRLRRSRGHCR